MAAPQEFVCVPNVTNQSSFPQEFVCSITQDIMISPVIAGDGHRYEKDAIVEWIRRAGTSPLTRAPLRVEDLKVDEELRGQIDNWRNNLIKKHETAEGNVIVEVSLPRAEPIPQPLPVDETRLTEQDINCIARFLTRTYYCWVIISVTIIIIFGYLGIWGKFN